MNWYTEYEKIIRAELKLLGFKKQLNDRQLEKFDTSNSLKIANDPKNRTILLSMFFFSVVDRLVPSVPREVILYEGFDFKGQEAGINRLLEKVKKGNCLTPNLSDKIFEIDQNKYNDPMLISWRINHFHIPELDGNGFFVSRSKFLLFAIITNDLFIPVDVQPHKNTNISDYDPWVDIEIIEKIEQHYPSVLAHRLTGTGKTPLTSEQRRNAMDKNSNTKIITSVGNLYESFGALGRAGASVFGCFRSSDINMNFIKSLNGRSDGRLQFANDYMLQHSP